MLKHVLGAAALLAIAASPIFADSVAYQVTIDTSTISGTAGYLELQLNTGTLPAAAVSASVQNFTGAALHATDPSNFSSTGSLSLPGTLNLGATTSTDYFEAATFGSSITFDVFLSGPGVSSSGNATSSSSTDFIIDFLDSSQSTYLLTNNAGGVVGMLEVTPVGYVNGYLYPNSTGGESVVTFAPLSSVPEPSTFTLASLALLSLCVRKKNR